MKEKLRKMLNDLYLIPKQERKQMVATTDTIIELLEILLTEDNTQ